MLVHSRGGDICLGAYSWIGLLHADLNSMMLLCVASALLVLQPAAGPAVLPAGDRVWEQPCLPGNLPLPRPRSFPAIT